MTLSGWLNRRIGNRILAAFALVAILTSIVAVVSAAYLRSMGDNLSSVSDRLRILQKAAVELRLAVEQESDGTRGYLLTGNPSFKSATAEASTQYVALVAELRRLGTQEDLQALAEIDSLHTELLDIARTQSDLRDQGSVATAQFMWETQGNQVKQILNDRLASLAAQKEASIAIQTSQARTAQNEALIIAIGIVGLTWAASIGIGLLICRSITSPIGDLVTAAEKIGKGDLTARVPDCCGPQDELSTLGVALNRMAEGIEEAQKTRDELYRQEQQRADQMRAINDAGRQISSILDLDQLLPSVARQVQRMFPQSVASIFLIEGEHLVLRASAGEHRSHAQPGKESKIGPAGIVSWVAKHGEPVVAPDVSADPRFLAHDDFPGTKAELAVPVKVKDRVVGVLDLQSDRRESFNETDRFIAETMSSQLAVAIENARLYSQASEFAALQERQRLARDLHDAVTQTLFSASLIADVLPRLWKKDPAAGEKRVEELRQLTRGALAEMRMLLLELRPAALNEATLGSLLRHLADAAAGRSGIKMMVAAEEDGALPLPVQTAFYRIAQESINNIIRHSAATSATIRLKSSEAAVTLDVIDDGKGFDAGAGGGDHLGLRIMQERAQAIGAKLTVESGADRGTSIRLVWART